MLLNPSEQASPTDPVARSNDPRMLKHYIIARLGDNITKAALAHLGERQTEVHFMSRIIHVHSGGTVFDPQKRHSFCFCSWRACSCNSRLSHSFCLDHVCQTCKLHVCRSPVHHHCKRARGRSLPSRLDSPAVSRSKPFRLRLEVNKPPPSRDNFHKNPILHPSNTVDALTVAVLSPHTYPSSQSPLFAIAHDIGTPYIHDKFTGNHIQTPTRCLA